MTPPARQRGPAPDSADLAARLAEVTANLTRTSLAPLIAAAEVTAAARIAELEGQHKARLTRAAELEDELRRQINCPADGTTVVLAPQRGGAG